MSRRPLIALFWILAFAVGALAHHRIVHPSTGAPLFWSNPGAVGIVISSAGSDNVPDSSDEVAVRSAIQAWNQAPGSIARLVEDDSDAAQALTNWESDALHLVWFDEDNTSGYFPNGSSTVAITPIWFFSSGTISDADVIYNGRGFNFTTTGVPGRFDIEDVGVHELGHLLGLDHSAYSGASMYPYVDSTIILHRSLSLDDIGGMRAAYPGSVFGSFTGRVLRGDATPVVRAHVVAVDSGGRTSGAILTDAAGNFQLVGLDEGTYRVYAAPLDGPVGSNNLSSSPQVDTDFEATDYVGTFFLPAATPMALGDLTVGADVSVALGRSADRLPLRGIRGQTNSFSLRGAGLSAGSVLLCSDGAVSITPISWLGSMVSFQATIPANAPLGHVDLEVTGAGGGRAVLPAAIEITPPDPVVTDVTPDTGSPGGGVALTIEGGGFRPGARVVLGNRIYTDGEPGGCTVVDDSTITLTTADTEAGTHDLVVLDESGVEGRLLDGFQTALQPGIDLTFPPAGNLSGGTRVTLTGTDFDSVAAVRIDGVPQDAVDVLASDRLEFTTTGTALAGLYSLEVEDLGGAIATSNFVYSADPDPLLEDVDPPQGDPEGGQLITLLGENFESGMEVRFGVDPDTGSGGVPAVSVAFVDDQTLMVETPPGLGLQAVLVSSSAGQADVLEAAYQFGSDGTGGGGCGGTTIDPRDPRAPLTGSAWVLALALFALLRGSSVRRAPA